MKLKDLAEELEMHASSCPPGDLRFERAWDALSLGMMLLSISRELKLECGRAASGQEQKQEQKQEQES